MELAEIIEIYNDIRREKGERGVYIIHKAITPNKSFSAYKEFKITLYFHKDGENQVVIESKNNYKAAGPDETRSCWTILEEIFVKELIKWFMYGTK